MERESETAVDFGASRWWVAPRHEHFVHLPFYVSQMQGDVCYELEGYHVRIVDGYTCQSHNMKVASGEGQDFLPHLGQMLASHLLSLNDPARTFEPALFCQQIATTSYYAHPNPLVTQLLVGRGLVVQKLYWYWADHSAIRYRTDSGRGARNHEGGFFEPEELEPGPKRSFIMGLSCKIRLSQGQTTTHRPYLNVRMRLMRVRSRW